MSLELGDSAVVNFASSTSHVNRPWNTAEFPAADLRKLHGFQSNSRNHGPHVATDFTTGKIVGMGKSPQSPAAHCIEKSVWSEKASAGETSFETEKNKQA